MYMHTYLAFSRTSSGVLHLISGFRKAVRSCVTLVSASFDLLYVSSRNRFSQPNQVIKFPVFSFNNAVEIHSKPYVAISSMLLWYSYSHLTGLKTLLLEPFPLEKPMK